MRSSWEKCEENTADMTPGPFLVGNAWMFNHLTLYPQQGWVHLKDTRETDATAKCPDIKCYCKLSYPAGLIIPAWFTEATTEALHTFSPLPVGVIHVFFWLPPCFSCSLKVFYFTTARKTAAVTLHVWRSPVGSAPVSPCCQTALRVC